MIQESKCLDNLNKMHQITGWSVVESAWNQAHASKHSMERSLWKVVERKLQRDTQSLRELVLRAC